MTLVVLAVALIAAPAGAAECHGTRLVALGEGCVDLPCEWHATIGRPAIDSSGGYIRASTRPDDFSWVHYDGGFLFALQHAEVVSRRLSLHRWRLWWHAEVEFAGARQLVATNGHIFFIGRKAAPDAEAIVERLAAGYRTDIERSECELPEPFPPGPASH